ncbi:AAA family ATPase [Aureispira sp. CCB-QB1]|uniref:AAA family ATPase n=1 Tax=Aureispira sp. CCB-QB1 TaxID=1313421 RepID=UPI0018CBFA52|nr:AAA family ATPase [Aureispira sp. CCB-QB1]
MKQEEQHSPAVYFKSLTIEGIHCFKSEQTIDLTDNDDNPAMWTVILGNNNTGKTTLLRCLAGFETISISVTPPLKHTSKLPKTHRGFHVSLKFERAYDSRSYSNTKAFAALHNFWLQKEDAILNSTQLKHKNLPHNTTGFYLYSSPIIYNPLLINEILIDAYGTQRKQGKSTFIEYQLNDRTESLFKDDIKSIINAEEWFLGTKFDALNGDKKAQQNLTQITHTLVSILPDITNIEIGGNGNRRVHFVTKGGERVLVNQLGSGYQSLVTWVVDFAKRMFDRYPTSDNPLAEPAIVLVDEIDLHLHPEWQRKIVSFLRDKFPKTQFIVTAHSPLVIQSSDDINVVVLQKNEETDEVSIYQPKETNFQGWTIEEILSDLMGMGAKIRSDKYLELLSRFNEGLDEDNYQLANIAFEELKQILNPQSAKLELLKLQMASLSND